MTRTTNLQTVRQTMRAVGLTQLAASKALGLSQVGVSDRLKGRVHWRAHELATIADICGVDMNIFFGPVEIDIRPVAASNITPAATMGTLLSHPRWAGPLGEPDEIAS